MESKRPPAFFNPLHFCPWWQSLWLPCPYLTGINQYGKKRLVGSVVHYYNDPDMAALCFTRKHTLWAVSFF